MLSLAPANKIKEVPLNSGQRLPESRFLLSKDVLYLVHYFKGRANFMPCVSEMYYG